MLFHLSQPGVSHKGSFKTETPAPQVTPAYMTNKSLAFCLFIYFFLILTSKCGNANTAVEMQAVPYFALCVTKKTATSIMIQSFYCNDAVNKRHSLIFKCWAGPVVGPTGK